MQRPARDAAPCARAGAAEERVRDGLARRAEVHADARLGVGPVGADLAAELAQQLVGGVVGVDGDDAEHPLRRLVVRRERARQSSSPAHCGIGVEALGRAVERVRVAERAAADAAPDTTRRRLKIGQPEDAAQPSRGARSSAAGPRSSGAGRRRRRAGRSRARRRGGPSPPAAAPRRCRRSRSRRRASRTRGPDALSAESFEAAARDSGPHRASRAITASPRARARGSRARARRRSRARAGRSPRGRARRRRRCRRRARRRRAARRACRAGPGRG